MTINIKNNIDFNVLNSDIVNALHVYLNADVHDDAVRIIKKKLILKNQNMVHGRNSICKHH